MILFLFFFFVFFFSFSFFFFLSFFLWILSFVTLTRQDLSKVQDDEVGDGTTSVCVFASELLREAEKLIGQRIHPQTIIEGWVYSFICEKKNFFSEFFFLIFSNKKWRYRIAAATAREALEKSSVEIGRASCRERV